MPSDSELAADWRKAASGHEYVSTKTYNHSIGLSTAFRQWRAHSHCRFLHGYAIKVHFEFVAQGLDQTNWVVDFGSLKPLKGWLEDMFDHKTLVAYDDPQISMFRELSIAQVVDLREVPATGCEMMARMIYEFTEGWLKDAGYNNPRLQSVQVCEHEANSAIYRRKMDRLTPDDLAEVKRMVDGATGVVHVIQNDPTKGLRY